MSDRVPSVPTRVGLATGTDNLFAGFSVLRDLVGNTDFWSMISLAVGHRRLSPDEVALMNDLCVCGFAGDPRIWPLKVSRLASSHHGTVAGLCGAFLACDQALIGPDASERCAQWLAAIVQRAHDEGEAFDLQRAVEVLVGGTVLPLPGFGVPFRSVDERVVALRGRVEASGRSILPAWRMLQRIETIVADLRGWPVNVAGVTAAALLDLGFEPRQMGALCQVPVLPSVLANAVEGARSGSEILRRIPRDALRYVGAPARRSPRAMRTSDPPKP